MIMTPFEMSTCVVQSANRRTSDPNVTGLRPPAATDLYVMC